MDKKKMLQEENDGLRAYTQAFKDQEEKLKGHRVNGHRSQADKEYVGGAGKTIELKEDSSQGQEVPTATLKASINVDMSRGGKSPRDNGKSRTDSIDIDEQNESGMVMQGELAGQTLFLQGSTINQNNEKRTMEYQNMDIGTTSVNRFHVSDRQGLNQGAQQNAHVSRLESLGGHDSILQDNSSQRKTGSYIQGRHLNNQDSLNHMVIKSSMQPHGSSLQMTLAETSQLQSNSKQEMQTRREYDEFQGEQSMNTEFGSSPLLKTQSNQIKDINHFAMIKQEVTVTRQKHQQYGGMTLSNHMRPEDENNVVAKQLHLQQEQQYRSIKLGQSKKSNTRNKARLDFQTTTDLNAVGQLNTIRDHEDPDLTLRTVDGRQNSSMMSLQNVHKSQGSPLLGSKRGSKGKIKDEKATMAPGFASLPRIDLNKNVSNLSEVFPYNDMTGKNTRSHTQTKYSKGNFASQQATMKNTLPLKDTMKPNGAKLQSQIFDRQNFHISQQFFRKRTKQLKTHNQLTASPGGRQNTASGTQTAGQFFPKRAPNIKEALLAPLINESSDKDKPDFHLSQEDLIKLHKGKRASKQFLQDNKEEIQKFIDHVMNSEEKMMGYLEFSNKNMILNDQCPDRDVHIEHALNSVARPSLEADAHGKSIMNNEGVTTKSEEDGTEMLEKIRQKNARYLFDPANTTKNNKAYMSVMQRRQKTKQKGQNATLDSIGITSKVMETWINETLTDAEHLDIPGCILQPEHKNPITRYGIDRIEMDNCGVPRDFVDRIYRCLFVYSVGFYEMIKNLIQHSNQKYSLVTRIWKVFAVLLEYCCVTDYKMMITQISSQHEQEVEQLKAEFADKLNECFDNEKILKQNIAALQKSNEDMERERTNERSLRLRLEEEYMQNTKNHEEEVQLRLKFESKLNMMHTQQRETDIKFKRVTEENLELKSYIEVLEKQLKEVKESNYSRGLELSEKAEKLALLEEQKYIYTKDIETKTEQIEKLDTALRLNNQEVNESRYSLAQIQAENHKLMMQVDQLNLRSTNLLTRNEALENMFNQARLEKQEIEDQSQQLKEQVNSQIVSISEQKQKDALNTDELKSKKKLLETQKAKITEQNQFLEDLSLIKQSQGAEIEALKEQLEAIRKDFDESAEKLHKTNRYRHELELRYQAEKLTQERLQKTLVEREAVLDEQNKKIINLNDKMNQREKRVSQLQIEVKDLKEDISTKTTNFNMQIGNLQEMLEREKGLVEEWADKYNQADSSLKTKSDTVQNQDQQIRLLEVDRDRLTEKLDATQLSLQNERSEREDEQKKSHDNLLKMQKTQHELQIMLQVSRQQEMQRLRQRDQAEERQAELEQALDKLTVRASMEYEDVCSQLYRLTLKYQAQEEKLAQVEKENKQEYERSCMQLEDLRRHLFNSENKNQVLEFTIIDLKDKLDLKEERINKESIESKSRESREQTVDIQSNDGNSQHQPGLSVIHETRKSSNVQDMSHEDIPENKGATESIKQLDALKEEAAKKVNATQKVNDNDDAQDRQQSASQRNENAEQESQKQENSKLEISKQPETQKKESRPSAGSKSGKSNVTVAEKDGKKKEFKDVGVQVGGGDANSNHFPSSNKDMSRQTSSQSPSKNEKLVSDLRRTATKNSLLKAKAYKPTSFTGFPSASTNKKLQSHMSSGERSSKSKHSSISPGRKAEHYQELKNAEEFVRIEQESQRSRFSKNKIDADDMVGTSRQLSNMPESMSSKKEQKSVSSKFRGANKDAQDNQSNSQITLSNMVRKDKQSNDNMRSSHLIEDAQNSQQKFAQTTQQTQQRWANQTDSRLEDERALTSQLRRANEKLDTQTDANQQQNLLDGDQYQRSQTQFGGMSKDPSDSMAVTKKRAFGQGQNKEITSDPRKQNFKNEPNITTNRQNGGSSSNNKSGVQGHLSTGPAALPNKKGTNLSSEDQASTIFQHVHNPSTEDHPGLQPNSRSAVGILSGQMQRQHVKLTKNQDADPNSNEGLNVSPSLNKSSNLSTLQGPITMAVEEIVTHPGQQLQSMRQSRPPYAGNSVEHHQHMGQMMDQMVNQLGLGYDGSSSIPSQPPQQHTITTAQLEQKDKKKPYAPPKDMNQIKALIRGAQSRDRFAPSSK